MGHTAKGLAHALNGRQLSDGSTISVVGVHTDGPTIWIQMALHPGGQEGVLHLPNDGADAEDAVRTLERYLLGRQELPHVIQITRDS